jgi:superfamily I DNA and RNA helicase
MKRILGILFTILVLVSCNSQKVYSDFDISYSKSGGFAPIYENLLIKGNNAHYSFEGQGKKLKQDFKISDEDLKKLDHTLSQNNFRRIDEDRKKIYDNIATSISVKSGSNEGSKTDASSIMPNFKTNWANITNAFQEIINNNVKKQ